MANLLKYASLLVIICSSSTVMGAVTQCFSCSEPGSNSDCAKANNATMVKQTCGAPFASQLPPHLSFLSNPKLDGRASNTWLCAKVETEDMSDAKIVFTVRGCVPEKILTQKACDYIEHGVALIGHSINTCKTCSENLCNSSTGLQVSFVLITLALFSKLLFL